MSDRNIIGTHAKKGRTKQMFFPVQISRLQNIVKVILMVTKGYSADTFVANGVEKFLKSSNFVSKQNMQRLMSTLVILSHPYVPSRRLLAQTVLQKLI